jgi:chromodomain-helicase-DNA-binding protein 7
MLDDEPVVVKRTTRSRQKQQEEEEYDEDQNAEEEEDDEIEEEDEKDDSEDEDFEEQKKKKKAPPKPKPAPERATTIRRRSGRGKRIIDESDFQPNRELRSRGSRVTYREVAEDEDEDNDDEEEEEEETTNDNDTTFHDEDSEEEEPKPKKKQAPRARKPAPSRVRGRVGGRAAKRRVADSDDEEEDEDEEPAEIVEDIGQVEMDEDNMVEKIIACRAVKQKISDGADDENDVDSLEYLVKYKEKSYMHCEWVLRSEIESQARGKDKTNRFHKLFPEDSILQQRSTTTSGTDADDDELTDYFNADWLEVDRILDVSVAIGTERKVYLVKWKSQQYAEATWEYEEDINQDHKVLERFYHFRTPPPVNKRKPPPKPSMRNFTKIEPPTALEEGKEHETRYQRTLSMLRDYQIQGVNWLVFNWYKGQNSILADEMGLGKTVQTVTTLEYLHQVVGNRGPFLIVAPLSTIGHWRREVENWSDMNPVVLHGSQESRNMIYQYEFHHTDPKDNRQITSCYKWNVLITTYETILAESARLGKIKWQYLVVDEGHRLKNKKSKLMEVLKAFKSEHKLLLTGTPLQNDMEELWSLLNFLDPTQFPSSEDFLSEFGDMKDSSEVEKLHKQIKPYLLRRLKEDVEKSIPPKEEIVVEVVPTNTQKTYYRAILDRNREFLKRGLKSNNVPKLVNILMEIRKVCNHPFLITGAEEQITKGMTDTEINECLIRSSSKLMLVDKLLHKLRENKHKVLIFSQMVKVLHILEDFLQHRNYPYVRLDGSIRGDLRQEAIDKFCDEKQDVFVFLVSTRAGGVGINLTAADTVIIYDSDWNPQNDLQAQARCHRIGQTKEVKIYRLLTKNTREKEMFERASKKLGLDRAVLNSEFGGGKDSNATGGLEKEEIDVLLKFGAYAAHKDDSAEEKLLVEGDIDSILERTATIVRYEGGTQDEEDEEESGTAGNKTVVKQSEKGLSSFAKATFCFSQSDMEIDINDADFWVKILPESKNAEGLASRLNEKDGLKTDDEKMRFLQDLEALVNARIEGRMSGIIKEGKKGKQHDPLDQLLTQLHYSYKFDAQQRELIQQWQDRLDKPRLRSGGERTIDIRSAASASDAADSEYESEGKSKKMYAIGGWYKAERLRFQKAFLELGWGKWVMLRNAKLKQHSVDEIHSFAESFIQQMIVVFNQNAKEFEDKLADSKEEDMTTKHKQALDYTRDQLRFLNRLIESSAVPYDSEETYVGKEGVVRIEPAEPYAAENATIIVPTEIEELKGDDKVSVEIIRIGKPKEGDAEPAVESVKMDETKDEEVPKEAPKEASAPDDVKHDEAKEKHHREEKDVVIRFTDISKEDREDGRFTLPVPGYAGNFILKVTINGEKVLWSNEFTIPEKGDKSVHPILAEPEFVSLLTKGIRNWVKKMRFQVDLYRVLEIYGDKLKNKSSSISSSVVPKMNLKEPAPWWDEEADRDLLIGLAQHGYGRFDSIKQDRDLCFSKKFDTFVDKVKTSHSRKDNKEARETWPTTGVLNKRATKLIATMLNRAGKMSMLASGTGHGSDDDSDDDTDMTDKMLSMSDNWSKREKGDMQKCVLQHGTYPDENGIPQYGKIIKFANLKKHAADVALYLKQLIEYCKTLDDEEKEKEARSIIEEFGIDVEAKNAPTLVSKEDIAQNTAKKVLQRCRIMIDLKRFVFPNIEEMKDKLAHLKVPGSGLPRWWKPIHDAQIIKGVKHHGFNFKELFEDKKLIFVKVKEEEEKTSKAKDFSFPREGLCLNRLQTIGRFFQKMIILGSPTKSKTPGWGLTPKKKHVIVYSPDKNEKKEKKKEEPQKPRTVANVTKKKTKQSTLNKFVGKDKEDHSDDEKTEKEVKKRKRTNASRPASVGGTADVKSSPPEKEKGVRRKRKLDSGDKSDEPVEKKKKLSTPPKPHLTHAVTDVTAETLQQLPPITKSHHSSPQQKNDVKPQANGTTNK